jgi:peptidoglycan hydrolase CwlO-like protein
MATETIISIVIAFCALLFTALSFRRTQNQDTSASATERATMTADVRYIRQSIDEIKLENGAIQKDVTDLKTKIVEVEASVKSAHKRLDDMQQKG